MRVPEPRLITPPRGDGSVPVGTPPRPFQPITGPRAVAVSPRVIKLVLANAVIAIGALSWLLPAPWGGLVPVSLLAQLVWYRHGSRAAAAGLLLGGGLGAGAGQLLGMGDWRRAVFAMLLLVLPAMIAWPARPVSLRTDSALG